MTSREKLKSIREELKQMFLERADLIDGALAALLSSHHLLIIGPPGTAKSMLADELCRRIEGANYFQWLLTRFTTPEEIFGAVSLKALEQDDYRRVTTRKLPEAHIAFLDEIFKANSSILNAILTLINERLFHNGKEVGAVPLLTLFGASNELPEEEELTALYDRFLLRFVVNYIAEDFRFLRMLESQKTPQRTVLTLAELTELQHEVREITLPAHVYRSIADIRRELNKKISRPPIAAIANPYPCCKPMLTWKAKQKFTKNTFSSWSTCSGAIRRNTSQCAARFASCCSVTRRKLPSCFTSRARFATRRCNPPEPATNAPAL